MKTVHTAVAAELTDFASDILRRVRSGSPMSTAEMNLRADAVKGMIGAATDDEIQTEIGNLQTMGGDGGGP